jgi:hypothetical protein
MGRKQTAVDAEALARHSNQSDGSPFQLKQTEWPQRVENGHSPERLGWVETRLVGEEPFDQSQGAAQMIPRRSMENDHRGAGGTLARSCA